MRYSKIFLTLSVIGYAILVTEPCHRADAQTKNSAPNPGYDRPTGAAHQSRSEVLATQGIVATSQPLAAQAGLDVLRQGGNAADAAIAANAMIGVVEPMSCGIGGDLFMIYWDSKTQKLYGLNASGRSPATISRAVFEEKKLAQIPLDGPLSWSVPGCVSGWQAINERFGTRPLEQLLAPAADTAETGFPVTEVISGYWKSAQNSLAKTPESAKTFLIDGKRAPQHGEVFRNPYLAKTLRTIGTDGAQVFYQGSIAKKIAEFSQANGGYLSLEDLAKHHSDWIEPVSTNYRGYDVWELPPNGQGIAALQILNLMEPYDVASMGQGSADYIHLFTEAKRLAFADRAKFYADPDFNRLPTDVLISKSYAKKRGRQIDMRAAAKNVPAGDPKLQHGDTIYLTVVDKDRNCCSLIQSNYYGFGSKMTAGDLGFALQNRGALFSLSADHLNSLEPEKRPFHTIIPAMVTRQGKPWFCYGVMGGDMQPQGHVQVLINLIDFKMNVQMAGDDARVRHSGSQTPTGIKADGVGELHVESGVSDEVIADLEKRGHHVERSKGSFGGYQGILIDWEKGILRGGTESRKDGMAVGY